MVSQSSGFLLSVLEGSDGGIGRLAAGSPREADPILEPNRVLLLKLAAYRNASLAKTASDLLEDAECEEGVRARLRYPALKKPDPTGKMV